MSERNAPEERDLVDRCNRGEQAAWTSLYRTYREQVYRITHWRRWRFAPEEADEVMQEVFLALVSSLRTFEFRSSLGTFISQIAANACISALRRQTAIRAGGKAKHLSLDGEEARLADGDRLEDRLLAREEQKMLQNGFRLLSRACQSILRRRFIDGLSYDEMASILGVKEGTVASRLSRCIAELREICERLCGVEGKKFLGLATRP